MVISAYRCPKQNDIVRGARNSQHLYGKAADLLVPRGQQGVYVSAAYSVPAFKGGGVGIYPGGGVHVDRRGWVARWTSFTR